MEWWQDVQSLHSSLNWFRSWPLIMPEEPRAYVHDYLPRLGMVNCNYDTIETWPADEPGFCLLEWDIALDIEGRSTFASIAEEDPGRVLVAPYIKSYGGAIKVVHRDFSFDSIQPGDTQADFAGFGCIYLPQRILKQYLSNGQRHPAMGFTDVSFSQWYRWTYGPIEVTWEVHPQHLHE